MKKTREAHDNIVESRVSSTNYDGNESENISDERIGGAAIINFSVPDAPLIRVNTVYADVVHTTAKQVISRRGKNENVCEMCQKLKNARAKRAKLLFFIVKYANLRRSSRCRRRGCLSSLT